MINTILNILSNVQYMYTDCGRHKHCISLISLGGHIPHMHRCIISPRGHKKLWGTRTPAQTLRIHPLMKAPSGHSYISGHKKAWFRQKSVEMVVMLANRVRTDYVLFLFYSDETSNTHSTIKCEECLQSCSSWRATNMKPTQKPTHWHISLGLNPLTSESKCERRPSIPVQAFSARAHLCTERR